MFGTNPGAGIMGKLFGSSQQQPQQTGQQGTPGNIPPVNANPPLENNTMVPTNSATAIGTESSLDKFKDLWKNDPKSQPPKVEPYFNVDPAKIAEAAKNNDFLKIIPPELLEKIKAGGEDAMPAMMAAMNAMSQKGFGDSAVATTKIVEDALEKQAKRFEQMLPGLINKQTLSDTLRKTNPVFEHPAAETVLKALTEQVRLKNPSLSPAQQAEMANEYLISLSQAANPPKPDPAVAGATDWSTFL
jgi:hypothetical protein